MKIEIGATNEEDAVGTREWMKTALRGLALIGIAAVFGFLLFSQAGCHPKPPVIVPTPPPDEQPVDFSALEVTATPDGRLVRAADPSYQPRKCISCCAETVGTGWPGLSPSWIDFSYQQGQCNLLHWRVGPSTLRSEPEWAAFGGGPYVEVDGKADLTRFNDTYFAGLRAAVIQAAGRGANVEVSLVDGWAVKTQCWRSNGLPGETCGWHAWHPAGNIQGADHLKGAYRGVLDGVHTALVNRVFEAVGDLPVLFEDGTELDQLEQTGRSSQGIITFSLTMEALLRQAEAAHGWRPHLFGTNYVGDASMGWLRKGRYQYQNVHWTQPMTNRQFFGDDLSRPLIFDEYNPTPPMKPEEVRAFACYCRAHGCYWAAWRHDQDRNAWLASLSLIAQDIQGCPASMNDGCPYDVGAVASVSCKVHGYPIYDCTPKNGSGNPILKEGAAARALCEQSAAGLAPGEGVGWNVSGATGGSVSVSPRENRWQFTVSGAAGASAILHCKLPRIPDACGGLRVTVR